MKLQTKEQAEQNFSLVQKEAERLVDKFGLKGQTAQVVLVTDKSGSIEGLFRDGTVQAIIERSLALALQFDDDGVIPSYLFSSSSEKADDLRADDFFGYAQRISDKYGIGGSTNFSKVIIDVINDHFPSALKMVKGGKSGGIFSKRLPDHWEVASLQNPEKDPVFVVFLTDGEIDRDDKSDAEEMIRLASKLPMFIQFIGIGRASFKFLEGLDDMKGRYIDNAGFCVIENPETATDEEFLAGMLNEFPDYLKEARKKGLVV